MKMKDALRSLYLEAAYHSFDIFNRECEALEAIKDLQKRTQMLFCITNGRSGSQTLSRLFSCISGVVSEHEARPGFHMVMRRVQANPDVARKFWLYSKFPALASTTAKVYVDTTHFFGKGFFEPLLDLGIVPNLILLRRNRRAIASSLYALGTIPGRTPDGLKFYLSPGDSNILSIAHWQDLSDYQLCYWHTLEIEARQRAYGQRCRELGGRAVEVDLEDLSDPDKFFDLVCRFGIELDDMSRQRISKLAGGQFNRKTRKKANARTLPNVSTLEEAEQVVEHLVTTNCPRVYSSARTNRCLKGISESRFIADTATAT